MPKLVQLGLVKYTMKVETLPKPLAKAQRTRGLSSYYDFLINFNFKISIKHWTLKSQPNISIKTKLKILTKHSLIILTKIQLRNLNQTSAAKYWPNFSFKISPELQLQNLDQALCSKSEQFSKQENLQLSLSLQNLPASSATFASLRNCYNSQWVKYTIRESVI